MYQNGYGVERDLNQAAHWFTLAAEQNDEKAQSNLGQMYAAGQGVEKDPVKAYQWLSLASERGEATAKKMLFVLEPDMKSDQVTEGKRLAAEWKEQRGRK
jgi:TPR repeat protein